MPSFLTDAATSVPVMDFLRLGSCISPETLSVFSPLLLCLVNSLGLNSNFRFQTEILERVSSDHAPILFYLQDDSFHGRRIFRFENFWLQEKNFSGIVSRAWFFSSNQAFATRLHHLKNQLLSWNKNEIGNLESLIADNIRLLQNRESSQGLSPEEESLLILPIQTTSR